MKGGEATMSDGGTPGSVVGALVASGFPFQTAVAHAIRKINGWVIGDSDEEVPWRDDAGMDQFLDMVASNGRCWVTAECKKTQKEALTFLCPNGDKAESGHVRCLYLEQMRDSTRRMELFCGDYILRPPQLRQSSAS